MIVRVDVGAGLHVGSDEGLQGVPVTNIKNLRPLINVIGATYPNAKIIVDRDRRHAKTKTP